MHVLSLSNSRAIGGGNRSLLLLLTGIAKHGHQATVVIPEDGPMAEACRQQHLPMVISDYRQPSCGRPDPVWYGIRRGRKVIKQFKTSILHANDLGIARSFAIPAWLAGVPLICHVRFPFSAEFGKWVFRGLPKPNAFIFNSYALQREVGAILEESCPRSAQYVVHNAVDLKEFYPGNGSQYQPRVGILANLMPVKGHVDFLQMARLLKDKGVHAEYWVIGEDIHNQGYRQELENISESLGLNGDVLFLGHRRDISALLNQLDVLVCSSHVEPFGRCLIEAMACGRPVVASRVGGIPEVVVDGETGLLVPPHSPEHLAAAVARLLGAPHEREAMGMAGRRRVEQHFSVEAHVQKIMDIYGQVLGT